MKPLIIIAPDAYAGTLRGVVESAGFRAECSTDFTRILDGILERRYSLALVAIDRAESPACAQSRAVSELVPVIALTPACGGELCVKAFDCGADDCVPQSVSPRELGARIRNVLRRSGTTAESSSSEIARTLAEMRARVGDRVVNLTVGEVDVLAVLAEESPRPLTALEIAQRLGVGRASVEAHVKTLRAKLGRERLFSRGHYGYVYEPETDR